MKLIICEKNIAARRISYMISEGKSKRIQYGRIPIYEFEKDGEQWKVIGLRGHIINLDYPSKYNHWNKTDPKDLIKIDPEKKISNKGIADALKSLVNDTPFLIVATDFDREGELIGVEVIEMLKNYNKKLNEVKRAKFSSITGYEINKAFNDLTEVDYNLSQAGESRQIIDLVWGAVLTRFISLAANRFGKDFLSIGRVQSPTLAILVEREREIINFEPKTFWELVAILNKQIVFNSKHIEGRFWEEDKVKKIFEKIKNCDNAIVKKVEKKIVNEYPPSPFNTTSFLRSTSYLGISSSKSMSIAEELYMAGLISYPRTDNTVYPSSLNINGILKKLSESTMFSEETKFVLEHKRNYPTRGKKKTTDHPPIHPVGVPKGQLKDDKKKIYELIVRRFLATLSEDAEAELSEVTFDISEESFLSKGYRLIKPNWKKIYTYFNKKENILPSLEEGENVTISKVKLVEDKTKPPSRYSQGSLIAKMEELLLGTKSTRHEIINKLYSRKYIKLSPLKPTPLGMAVVDALEGCDVIKPKMTAVLEKDMNLIAEGKKTLEDTINESRNMLNKVVLELQNDKEKIKESIKEASKEQNVVGKCPDCDKNLLIRKSKRGKRFVGCSGYPNCKNTYPLPQKGGIVYTKDVCKICNTPFVKIITKGRKPWRICLNPDCSTKNNKKT